MTRFGNASRIWWAIPILCVALASCGQRTATENAADAPTPTDRFIPPQDEALQTESIWRLLRPNNPEIIAGVNKYLWRGALEVLEFLPVQSVDPYTGVIVTGFGTPPGGGRAYRATILINDPALDARSLNVALQSRGGPVSDATTRAVEDAILTRARQLRTADSRL